VVSSLSTLRASLFRYYWFLSSLFDWLADCLLLFFCLVEITAPIASLLPHTFYQFRVSVVYDSTMGPSSEWTPAVRTKSLTTASAPRPPPESIWRQEKLLKSTPFMGHGSLGSKGLLSTAIFAKTSGVTTLHSYKFLSSEPCTMPTAAIYFAAPTGACDVTFCSSGTTV
jgi:hypothetical protein